MIKVKLNAPPVGGAANEELIEVLSEALGVKKTSVHIIRGMSSKNKIVEIEGIGAVYGPKLQAVGIKTVAELMEKGKTPKGRKELSVWSTARLDS